jgi:hypothetical protein
MWKLLANQAQIGQSRSSVLNPLQWTLVIMFVGLGVLTMSHAPAWIIAGAGVGCFADLGFLLFSYGFFMRKNSDALRSEWYALNKLAIKKGRLGDNLQGFTTIDAPTSPLLPTSGPDQKVEEEQQGS